jgi:hypothetical protein
MNQPWECPRCHTINAPWLPYCNCKLDTAGSSTSAGTLVMDKFTAGMSIGNDGNLKPGLSDFCPVCGQFHGTFNGWPIHCGTL